MKYILSVLLSLIYCPFISIMITILTLLKGIWGNGFYLWMDEDALVIKIDTYQERFGTEYWKNHKFYIGEIFRWKYVRYWWNASKWHDA